MPIYEYKCKKCGHTFERIQKFSDPLVKKCPQCGGAVEQVISAPAVQFKGSGWYVTDYARKGAAGGKDGEPAKKEDAAKADAPKSESEKPGEKHADKGKKPHKK